MTFKQYNRTLVKPDMKQVTQSSLSHSSVAIA